MAVTAQQSERSDRVVQLANYGDPSTTPAEIGWADVRDTRRRITAADPHGGVAVSLDFGDSRDNHPGQKHEVGERLACVMRARVYGAGVPPAGRAIAAATQRTDGDIKLRFTRVNGALHAQGAARVIGFALCGPAPDPCRHTLGQGAAEFAVTEGFSQKSCVFFGAMSKPHTGFRRHRNNVQPLRNNQSEQG